MRKLHFQHVVKKQKGQYFLYSFICFLLYEFIINLLLVLMMIHDIISFTSATILLICISAAEAGIGLETWNSTSSLTPKNETDASKNRWKNTLKEIKALAVDNNVLQEVDSPKRTSKGTSKFLDQWKLLSDVVSDTDKKSVDSTDKENKPKKLSQIFRQRFDGLSWESRLEQWADEATAYLEEGRLDLYDQITSDSSEVVETAESNIAKRSKRRFAPRPAKEGEAIVPYTNIADKSKKIWIVTTAALPWMTGTAVNPLLRAAYLTSGRSEAGGSVTLMLPWLERESDQEKIYGKTKVFPSPQDQEKYIRSWLRDTANMKEGSEALNIEWYTARVEPLENSIYSMGDIIALIPGDQVDICVLEEPEHLNWYRAPGENWTTKFKHVVGIVHTNYFVYAQEQPAALIRAPGMRLLSSWMCRAHCHRIIKLSGTLGIFAPEKELIENVHGVRQAFLDHGIKLRETLQSPNINEHPIFAPEASPKVYFIGKMLWSKGIGSLMDLLKYAEDNAGIKIKNFDMYGGGPNLEDAKVRAEKMGLSMTFHGPIDHASLGESHKIFVNPSTSEVLCTTVAEALAMGKFVVVPSHPSNDFFAQFPNCLTYANKEEFVGNLYYALTHSPVPLTEEFSHALTWQAATERFEAAGCVTENEANEKAKAIALDEAKVEIDLPPLIDNEERRKQISATVKKTRERFRQFRSTLSEEIRQSDVLPKELKNRLVKELDKRLDLDVDTLLGSPKLKLQLSPAELDRLLLDLYNTVSEDPLGDVLRVIGGGSNVGRQSQYMKQLAQKEKSLGKSDQRRISSFLSPPPQFLEDKGTGESRTATRLIKRALQKNFQSTQTPFVANPKLGSQSSKSDDTTTQMTLGNLNHCSRQFMIKNNIHPRFPSMKQAYVSSSFRMKLVSPLI